ncbi:MAG TPA: GTP-binding protein [Pirellulales bacterium]|jgi:tRNA modification GTPase
MASDELTVAVLTPSGRGAVAVVAVDGHDAVAIVERFVRHHQGSQLANRRPNSIVYARWRGNGEATANENATAAEDVIVCVRDEHSVEVQCHGGHAAVARITNDLIVAGANQIAWQQWIARREPSRIRAVAQTALAQAVTLRTAAILLDQQQGALEAAIGQICSALAPLSVQPPTLGAPAANSVAVQSIRQAIESLLARASIGLHLAQPWRVVLAGPPNVGKSSLINALLGYQRAIVFDQSGTTRDAVTALTAFDGWPVVLTDTAGWRKSADPLEAAAIGKAHEHAAGADCLLLVFDTAQPWTDEHAQLINHWRPSIVVQNKIDLAASSGNVSEANRAADSKFAAALSATTPVVGTSALTGQGLDALVQAIVVQLAPIALSPGDAVPFTPEQVEQLQLAQAAIATGDCSTAHRALLSMLA